ncbi:MAG TPA: TldD/PmbA family protein [Anaerolineae bacterium]|nr:TldD/PmbA family protein [Anaerolineae bacterium]
MSRVPLNGRRPGMLGRAEIEDLLKYAVYLSEADETEAVIEASDLSLTRFARNAIHQNVAETDALLEVRAVFRRRVGAASTNDLSRAGVYRTVKRACALARHAPENPDWPGLPEPQPLPEVQAFDEAVAGMTPEGRARAVADICGDARALNLTASGAFSTGWSEYAVMNSKGLFAYAPSTQVDLTFLVERPQESASAYANATGWRLSQIDFEALKRQAIEHTLADRQPRHAPPGEYPVVLEPYAVANLLDALAEAGMGALAVQEERSWMNGRIGRRCLSPKVSIVDDAFDLDGIPQAFDAEGMPKRRVPIVVDGVPTSPVYDRLTAAREREQVSTGHAQPFDDDWDGPLPENLHIAPGDVTVQEMIRSIHCGLYVTRFWYVNLTTTHDCGVTGTTRDGVWWIERGELAYPVTDMRFDQELVPALGRVRGVGNELRTLSGWAGGVHRVPALALESFRFIDVGDGRANKPEYTEFGEVK